MKKRFHMAVAAILAVAAGVAFADATYPYTNPTYIPSAISPSVAYSAPTTYQVTLHNTSIVGFEINGTCTSLAATVQLSIDGTTWRTVNVYPITTGAISAAASISAAGAYRANVSGARLARLNVTALTATCNIAAVMSSGGVAPTL